MKRRSIWQPNIVLVVIAVGALLMAAMPASAEEKGWPRSVKCVGGSPGSMYYALNSAVAAIINKHLNVQASPSAAPGGSLASTKAIGTGEAEIGSTMGAIAIEGYFGKGPFEGKPLPIRALIQGVTVSWGFLAPKSANIKNIRDLKGHVTGFLYPGNNLAPQVKEAILKAAGLKASDVKDVPQSGVKGTIEAIKEGRIEVCAHIGGFGTAAYRELFRTKDMRMINMTPEQQAVAVKEVAWAFPLTMPKGTYRGVDEDVNLLGFLAFMACRADLPDSFVYQLTKAIFENFDEFTGFHPALKQFSPKKVDLVPIPHHAGAIKYYKEVGVLTPELEARNQAWLKEFGYSK